MSSVRAATALRVAARTSVVKSIARNAQQPARRYSSTQAHGSEKSSDLPWLLSALALTLPAVYMMRPSAYAHPSKEHKTAPFEAAKPEVPKSVDDAKERAAEFTETVKDTAAQATENVKEKSAEATEAVKDKAPAVSDKATAAKEKFEQTTQSRPAQEEEPKGDKGAENINDQSAFEHVKDRLENGVQRLMTPSDRPGANQISHYTSPAEPHPAAPQPHGLSSQNEPSSMPDETGAHHKGHSKLRDAAASHKGEGCQETARLTHPVDPNRIAK